MAVTCTNRKGKAYYLHVGKTKTGKPRWFMSTKADGNLAEAIPEGFEFYENPDGQVFVRKIQPKIVSDAEVELVRELARSKARTRYTMVDVKGRAIIVYSGGNDVEARVGLMSVLGADAASTLKFIEENMRYHPMLQFELLDETTRVFHASRWCFLGGIDGWFPLAAGSLGKLAEKFLPHLGAESFYELM